MLVLWFIQDGWNEAEHYNCSTVICEQFTDSPSYDYDNEPSDFIKGEYYFYIDGICQK